MIESVEGLMYVAKRLPTKYKEGMMRHLEDWEAQLEIWILHPEKLSKDEGAYRGIRVLARVLLGLEAKEDKLG